MRIDDHATGRVDQERAFTHLLHGRHIDHIVRFLRRRAMQANHQRLSQKFVECFHTANTSRLVYAVGQIWIVENHVESKGFGTQGGCGTDTAQTDYTEHLTA